MSKLSETPSPEESGIHATLDRFLYLFSTYALPVFIALGSLAALFTWNSFYPAPRRQTALSTVRLRRCHILFSPTSARKARPKRAGNPPGHQTLRDAVLVCIHCEGRWDKRGSDVRTPFTAHDGSKLLVYPAGSLAG